jgi:hypothetical protein
VAQLHPAFCLPGCSSIKQQGADFSAFIRRPDLQCFAAAINPCLEI